MYRLTLLNTTQERASDSVRAEAVGAEPRVNFRDTTSVALFF